MATAESDYDDAQARLFGALEDKLGELAFAGDQPQGTFGSGICCCGSHHVVAHGTKGFDCWRRTEAYRPMPAEINTLHLAAPRYIDIPFPPYRFVPGRHPHPNSPQGHSHLLPGETEPPVIFHPPEDWAKSPDYLYGCDLYNHGYWWEAHEAWEGLWHKTAKGSPQRSYLQGLIQVSARHLKLFLGHMEGVERLRETGTAHLRKTLDAISNDYFMGIHLSDWLARVDAYYEAVVHGPQPPRHDPGKYPYILPEKSSF
ncbi:MAG: DUF309 domain-containing protein [Phycisphaerales bacterium]|nr:DUF309 domain-containing protein [Phycisphaerales bacterium]